jgi:TolB-like protein
METPFQAYSGDEPYVFVCYAHEDGDIVYPEMLWLREQGTNLWYDEGISAGKNWRAAIGDSLLGARHVLFYISARSLESDHCNREINLALDEGKDVVPVYLEDVELTSDLKVGLNRVQALHRDQDVSYQPHLLNALGQSRSTVEPPATETQPAPMHTPRRSAIRWVTGAAIVLIVGVGFAVWRLIPPTLEATPDATPPEGSLDRSLAVPPFSVLGADADATTYADALTEELRAALTRYRELRTVSVPDSTEPHDVDQVSYVLDGSLQRMGDHLRVRARLIRTIDDQDVWAKSFEIPLADTSIDTAELATTMGRYVRLQLVLDQECETVRRTSRSEEAAHAYCSALTQVYQGLQVGYIDSELQMRTAQHALALDSEIVGAYYLVARSYHFMGSMGLMENWREARRNAYAAVDQGLARAPDSPRLLFSKGTIQQTFDFDYTGAEASFQAALASDPLHPNTANVYVALARLATQQGDLEGAREHARRALRVDDSDADIHMTYAMTLFYAGELEDVIPATDVGLRLVQTGGFRFYLLVLKAAAHAGVGEMVEANATMDEALASVGPGFKVGLAGSLARLGRLSEARVLLTQLEAMSDPPIEPMVDAYAALDNDRAFEWIHRAIDRRIFPVVATLRLGPTYTELRKDPRWDEVMAHLEAEEAKGSSGRGAPG